MVLARPGSRLRAVLAILLFLGMMLSGCTAPGGSDERDGTDADTGDRTGGGLDGGTTGDADGSGEDDAAAGDTDGTTQEERERLAREEEARNKTPVPPEEAEEEDPEALDRPGEYLLLPYREPRDGSVQAAVATWTTGDTWTYQLDHPGWDFACTYGENPVPPTQRPERTYTVTGAGRAHGIDVYRADASYEDCAGRSGATSHFNHTTSSLQPVSDEGYVKHELLFPLEDGKRWKFVNIVGKTIVAEVTYAPDHQHGVSTYDAWHVLLQSEHEPQSRTHLWYAAEVGNLLKREIRVDDHCEVPDDDGGCAPGQEKDDHPLYTETLISHSFSGAS